MGPLGNPTRQPPGQQLLISRIDQIALDSPDRAWIAVPVDNSDLSKGFKDISYGQLATGANVTAQWLQNNLGLPDDGFPAFAYMGPSDYRYALFAVAAAKLGYQIILPSTVMTVAGQHRILGLKSCSVYVYGEGTKVMMGELGRLNPSLQQIQAPTLEALMNDADTKKFEIQRSRQDEIENPWLVFHTSGTTGFPKVVTYSQASFSISDTIMSIRETKDIMAKLWTHNRVYLFIPPMHFSSMFMMLDATTFAYGIAVLGPTGRAPTPAVVKEVLLYANINGALLAPALIDALCQDAQSLQLLQRLNHVIYIGAPLSQKTGRLLVPHMTVAPAIGSTEAGPYWRVPGDTTEDWDYITFEPHLGAVMEHRADDRYELVFIRNPDCLLQTVFKLHPYLDRFETKDLWVEHPTKKGRWKIIGRLDDLIKLAHSGGIMVAPIESILGENSLIKNVLIGGQGRPRPIILIELVDNETVDNMSESHRADLIERLKPSITKANLQCHEEVRLDARLIVFATKQKPWPRTAKNTIARANVFNLYDPEIEDAYNQAGL